MSQAARTSGGLLVAAGVAVAVLGLVSGSGGGSVEVLEAGFVNTDRPGINAHNSPAVAADPRDPDRLAVADRIDSPRYGCTVSLSTNGGATWKPLALRLPDGAPNCFWPDVAFDNEGDLLVLFSATGGRYSQPVGVWLQRFDGETAEGNPVRVAGQEAFHAHFAVDGRRVFAAWVQTPPANADRPLGFEPGAHPILLARSDDGGATFRPPVEVSRDLRVAQPKVLAGPEGRVVVGALDLGDDVVNYEATHEGAGGPPPDGHWRVVAWSSTDGGGTFGPPAVVADRLPVPARVVIDLMHGPTFAADWPRNRVYAAWDAGQGDGRDVFLARSDDGGARWGTPVRIGPTDRGQFMPAVGVSPSGERVDVLFYDRSKDPADRQAEAVVALSTDGGATFSATTPVSPRPFDSAIGRGSGQGYIELGDELGVVSLDDHLVAFWADTSGGTIDTGAQDLAVARLDTGGGGGGDDGGADAGLVTAGLVLVGAGIGLLAVNSFRGRRG